MTSDVLAAILSETEYQEIKFPGHRHSTGEWLLIIEKCLKNAKRRWTDCKGDNAALHEVRQICACCVSAMEQNGAPARGTPIVIPEDDSLHLPPEGHGLLFSPCFEDIRRIRPNASVGTKCLNGAPEPQD